MAPLTLRLYETWQRALEEISRSQQLRPSDFNLLFNETYLADLNDQDATIVVPTFANFMLLTQQQQLIEFGLEMVIGHHINAKIIQEQDYKKTIEKEDGYLTYNLNPNYTFNNFIVGRSNAQAHVAAVTCVQSPGTIYNPLFIFGNTGLGKTHLLHAIGNQVNQIHPEMKVAYISSEIFVEGVYQSIKNKTIDDFKNQFKDLDFLLVDDIQFIAGKNKTHEIFFSIFNDLIANRKQVCITADKSPNDIEGLEERIISRFNQGLNINIESLEYETSLQIIKMKIANSISFKQDIDDDVLSYIATNCSKNVRTIEGALKRLLFYSIDFSNESRITLKVAVEALKDQVNTYNTEDLSISKIKRAVCSFYGVTNQQLTSKNRTKNITNARHIAMYLCRKILDVPYKEIGNEFGRRDHTTVMEACLKVESNIKTNPLYQKAVEDIENKIQFSPH